MSKQNFLKLKKGTYKVNLITKSVKSKMKILEYTLKGKSKETIIQMPIIAIPIKQMMIYLAAVGIEIIKKLSKIKIDFYIYNL